jgi:hypothetical protein
VAISHKLAGDVTFKVAFANRSTVAGDDLVIVGIDSDQNRGTGYSDGIDWEIYVPGDTPTLGWIYRWDAEDTSGVASVSWLNQAMTLTVNKAQVGNPTTAFNFGLISHTGGAMSLANVELFPHLGMPLLAYSLATEIARVQLPKAVSTVKAREGLLDPWREGRADDRRGVLTRHADRKATVGGKALKAQPGGLAWKMPKTAKGKKLVVTMTAAYQGMTTTQKLVLRVVK